MLQLIQVHVAMRVSIVAILMFSVRISHAQGKLNKLFDTLFSYHTEKYIKPHDSEIINLNNPYILN